MNAVRRAIYFAAIFHPTQSSQFYELVVHKSKETISDRSFGGKVFDALDFAAAGVDKFAFLQLHGGDGRGK